jgi:hypothetical protein
MVRLGERKQKWGDDRWIAAKQGSKRMARLVEVLSETAFLHLPLGRGSKDRS